MKKIFLLCVFLAQPVWADWQLDNSDSNLSFMSIKAGNAAEIHRFKNLSGGVDADGNITLSIHLISVDTKIPLRDQRMREMLFHTDKFTEATFTTTLEDMAAIEALAPGESKLQDIRGDLKLHGEQDIVSGKVQISRLSDSTIQVNNFELFIVDARAFDLLSGLEELRKVAGLTAISSAVPVSFSLTFTQQPAESE